LQKAKITRDDLKQIRVTGSGRGDVTNITTDEINEIFAAAKGAYFFVPSARIVIDCGAEEVRGVKLDDKGNVKDSAVNERCAAGAGAFIETMAKALEISRDEFVERALRSTNKIPINAQCVIFAESEVVSLIHSGASREDISNAIHDAMAERISSLVMRLGMEKDVVIMGGLADNASFIKSMNRVLKTEVVVPPNPSYLGAIGAVLGSD